MTTSRVPRYSRAVSGWQVISKPPPPTLVLQVRLPWSFRTGALSSSWAALIDVLTFLGSTTLRRPSLVCRISGTASKLNVITVWFQAS